MKKLIKKQSIDTSEFVSKYTGELLSSAIKNITSVNIINNDKVVVDSKEYFTVDIAALLKLEGVFNDSEIGKITRMSKYLHGANNVLINKNKKPFDSQSLSKELGYSLNSYYLFMKKLEDNSIINYLKQVNNRKIITYISFNPTFVRRAKHFNKDTMSMFDNLALPDKNVEIINNDLDVH